MHPSLVLVATILSGLTGVYGAAVPTTTTTMPAVNIEPRPSGLHGPVYVENQTRERRSDLARYEVSQAPQDFEYGDDVHIEARSVRREWPWEEKGRQEEWWWTRRMNLDLEAMRMSLTSFILPNGLPKRFRALF